MWPRSIRRCPRLCPGRRPEPQTDAWPNPGFSHRSDTVVDNTGTAIGPVCLRHVLGLRADCWLCSARRGITSSASFFSPPVSAVPPWVCPRSRRPESPLSRPAPQIAGPGPSPPISVRAARDPVCSPLHPNIQCCVSGRKSVTSLPSFPEGTSVSQSVLETRKPRPTPYRLTRRCCVQLPSADFGALVCPGTILAIHQPGPPPEYLATHDIHTYPSNPYLATASHHQRSHP